MRKSIVLKIIVVAIALAAVVGVVGYRLGGNGQERGLTQFIGFPQSFADVAAKVSPAVVNISTTTTVRAPGNPFRHFFGPDDEGPFGDFFKRYYGDIPDRAMKQQSLGSGFVIDRQGFIVTNNHVVEGADEIKVRFADGKEYTAKVIGRDPKTDLALIKISSLFKDIPTLSFGDPEKMRVGDWVLAVGNPFGLEHTVTQGIISATGRVIGVGQYDNFIQTSAPINPGNSGGPLVNLKGEVIGINTAIVATGQGIGFAIPSNMAKSVISQLKDKGKVLRGWIGVAIQNITPDLAKSFGAPVDAKGALVSGTVPDGPAARAGIQQGDIIVGFNGKEIKTMGDLSRAVAEAAVGSTVPVTVLRKGQKMTVTVGVTEFKEERTAAAGGGPAASGDLGLSVTGITPRLADRLKLRDKTGVIVVEISPNSPAEDAGIQPGDLIKEVNRTPVRGVEDYHAALKQRAKGEPLLLLVRRGGQTFYISLGPA